MEVIIQLFIAFGTISLAVIAVWGDGVRAWLAPPKLCLSLHCREGKRSTLTNGQPEIYYHLRIHNNRSWSRASNVRILATFVDFDHILPIQFTWAYHIQRQKKYQHVHDGTFIEFPIDIGGTEEFCDFVRITNEPILHPSLVFLPIYEPPILRAKGSIKIKAQAIADNCKSSTLSIEVSWDGKFAEDPNLMKDHIMFNVLEGNNIETSGNCSAFLHRLWVSIRKLCGS